jgi:hypothetical protein
LYEIDEKTKKDSAKCPFDFSCLSDKDWKSCAVKRTFETGLIEIEGECNRSSCPYCGIFGSAYFCHCPARSEIYRRFQI